MEAKKRTPFLRQPAVQTLLASLMCILLGLLIGYALRLDDRISALGDKLVSKVGGDANQANPAAGFVTACLLFCALSERERGEYICERS